MQVSVLMAVHNGGEFIKESIGSLINQSCESWELIIVENGSTDKTWDIVNQYASVEKRIRVFQILEKNKNKAFNIAYKMSKGKYFCFLAADDILEYHSLRIRLKSLKKVSKEIYKVSTCKLKTFSREPKFDSIIFPKNNNIPNYSGGCLFFNRPIAEELFPLPINLPNEDTWATLNIKNLVEPVIINQVLYRYRIHSLNSNGYGLNFSLKRQKFIERYEAYPLFLRLKEIKRAQLKQNIDATIKALSLLKKNKSINILFVKNLSFKEKFRFILYSNKVLFQLRNVFFRLISGSFQ